MRQPDFSPDTMPQEWLKAINEPKRQTIPTPLVRIAHRCRSRDDPLESYEHVSELQSLVEQLKRERIRRGLSLGDIARMTQQARSAISRLEQASTFVRRSMPLYRYARALGWHVTLGADWIGEVPSAEDSTRPPGRK